MKHIPILSAISITALLAAAGVAYAQQPPDVVRSDFGTNTAMGTGVMESLMPASTPYDGAGAFGNTGVGYNALLNTTTALYDTAVGAKSLQSNTTGSGNTAMGNNALNLNITGFNNTATGLSALASNTSGIHNVASGSGALFGNTTGQFNTASGDQALSGGNYPDMTGSYNTADGAEALFSNTTGYQNTASGYSALYSSTVGNHNTASGFYALYSNTNGSSNTADGDDALAFNTTGYENTASGSEALFSNTIGNINVALGLQALYSNTTGSNNIAVGTGAGYNLTYGNNNIDIGNEGVATESGKIRIGTPGTQTATYIAGIESAKLTGAAVYVTSSGQLGVLASSDRYKTAIAPMGANTQKLQLLRPVTFHLKSDPSGTRQYGLIAEEVAKVYPELVIRDAAGTIQGVRYDELAPMLLNEVQKQQQEAQKQEQVNSVQAAKIASLERQLAGIQAALFKLQPRDELVARR